jgi:AcrR family transcriptional regulator
MANVKRRIKPTLRQRQAQATRSMIVTAAQELFLERGYVGTTIEAIAEKAQVAVSTVYAIFGSKRGILRAIREAWHGRSHIRDVTFGSPEASDPHQRLVQLAQATQKQWETGSDVITIYTGAAAVDPEAAAELSEALAGRRRALQTFSLSLEPYLRHGMDVTRATAILQALCRSEVFDELVRCSGWPAEAYQAWLSQALERELLESNP